MKIILTIVLILTAALSMILLLGDKTKSEINTEPKENFITSTSVLWSEQIVSVEHDGHLFVVVATTDRSGGLGITHHPDCICNENK